jgi:hypothetical protein
LTDFILVSILSGRRIFVLNCLLVCRSLTYAQRAAKSLEKSGVKAIVNRTPYEISGGGCGYSVKIQERYIKYAITVLRRSGLEPNKIFTIDVDGRFIEVTDI